MAKISCVRRVFAAALAGCLLLLSPGIEPYRLLAASMGRVPARTARPVLGTSGGVRPSPASAILPASTPSLTPSLSPSAAPVSPPGARAATGGTAAVPALGTAPAAVRPQSPGAAAKAPAPGPGTREAKRAAAPRPEDSRARESAAPGEPSSSEPRPERAALEKAAKAPGRLSRLFDGLRLRARRDGADPVRPAVDFLRTSAPSSAKLAAPEDVPAGTEASETPAPEAAPARPASLPRRLLRKVQGMKDSFREFNSSEKAFILGQAVFLLAISIYLASLPLLVEAITGEAALTGVARMAHYWVFGGVSLFSGSVAKRLPIKSVLVGAALTRGTVFATIGILALAGAITWPLFLVLVGVNASIVAVNHLFDIDTDGARKVFSSDKKIEQAGYIYDFIFYGMMLTIPPLIGIPMDLLDALVGPGIGAAVGYTAFGLTMALAALIYARRLKGLDTEAVGLGAVARQAAAFVHSLPRRVSTFVYSLPARLLALYKARPGIGPLLSHRKIGALMVLAGAAVIGWTGGATLPLIAGGFLAVGGLIALFHWETLKIIWSKARARFTIETIIVFLDDAFFNVVLPTFALTILGVGATGNGLLISAGTLGGLLASMFLMKYARPLQDRMGTHRFLTLLTIPAALAFVPSIGLWAAPSLLLALPIVALIKIMEQPLRARMRTLLQTRLKNDPEAQPHSENVFGIMTAFEVAAAGAGGLAFSWLFQNSGPGTPVFELLGANAPMKVVTLALMAMSAVFVVGLMSMRRDLPVRRTFHSGTPLVLPRALGWLPYVAPRSLLSAFFMSRAEAKERDKLAINLARLGLPEAREITVREPVDPRRPTVAVLAPASVHKLSMAREGGRQSPGDVHLVLDPSWLVQETQPDGKARWLMKKGLFFDAEGAPWIATYRTPRLVRFGADFFTPGANDRADGLPLEAGADMPMSSSAALEAETNDKLLSGMRLAAKGVLVPATLAFLLAAHPLRPQAGRPPAHGHAVTEMPEEGAGRRDRVRASVEEFLAANKERLGPEVVVKPSGPMFHSGKGVEMIPVGEVDRIVDHVLALSADAEMTPDGAVLLQERLDSVPIYLRSGEGSVDAVMIYDKTKVRPLAPAEIPDAAPAEKKDLNLRVLVGRAPWGEGRVSGVLGRVGAWGLPTNGQPGTLATEADPAKWDPADVARASVFMRTEDIVAAMRLQHPELAISDDAAERLLEEIDALGEKAFAAFDEAESARERRPGEPHQARTHYLGLDVMLVHRDGRLRPYVIEVNDHDSGGQPHHEWLYPDRPGRASSEWVAGMLAEARRDALKGKRIVVVGAGYEGKRFTFERAKELGVKVVLVDRPGSWAKDLVDEHIELDARVLDGSGAVERAVAELEKRGLKDSLDGITTFWEDDIPLTARLAKELGLRYISPKAAAAARNKLATDALLEKAGLPVTPSFRISIDAEDGGLAEFERAMERIELPAILKPNSGAESKGTEMIRTREEALEVFERVRSLVHAEAPRDGAFSVAAGLKLQQFIPGDEVDVDIALMDGEPLFEPSVTDNWPTKLPSFTPTGASLPSHLPEAALDAARAMALDAARAVGLDHGVFHMEGKVFQTGVDSGGLPVYEARLIEANARMGGLYVRDWVLAVWGIDLAEQAFMVAAGIPGRAYKAQEPLAYLEGRFMNPSGRGRLQELRLEPDYEGDPGLRALKRYKNPGDPVRPPERAGFLETHGRSAREASDNLARLEPHLHFVIDPEELE